MDTQKTTNKLLLIIVIALIFYLLKTLSFIFIPLVLSMFFALLFLPLMRWLKKVHIPQAISLFVVLCIILGISVLGFELVKLSSNEIMSTKDEFIIHAETKITNLIYSLEQSMKISRPDGVSILSFYAKDLNILNNFNTSIDFITSTISVCFLTLFFVVLLLTESVNVERILNLTLLKKKRVSIKAFVKIEQDIIKFVIVKVIISAFTGLGFTLACYLFDISFPIFWGLLAFSLNFIQMIGSFISVILLTVFALVEYDPSATLLLFIISVSSVQIIMGGILEPVFMGKSFSINIITVLVMLMLWGYIWGVPGLILSIPITVFIKIILEQFNSSKYLAEIISGSGKELHFLKFKQ